MDNTNYVNENFDINLVFGERAVAPKHRYYANARERVRTCRAKVLESGRQNTMFWHLLCMAVCSLTILPYLAIWQDTAARYNGKILWSRLDFNRIGVNTAFTMLRTLIPTEPADRKLSKIETLRLACSYISHLGSLLVAGSCEKAGLKNGDETKYMQRPQVCTFCMALLKKPKGLGR